MGRRFPLLLLAKMKLTEKAFIPSMCKGSVTTKVSLLWRDSILHINNSLHLARKYARIFVRGHYLFREANSFPRVELEENCELREADYVQGQISEHNFAPNGGYRLYYPSYHIQGKITEC